MSDKGKKRKDTAPSPAGSKKPAKKPKALSLVDAVVAALDALGGRRDALDKAEKSSNAISLQALKKHLGASRGMDFEKTGAKNQLKKALEKATNDGSILKQGSSYTLPPASITRDELEKAWREQKIALPLAECVFPGYTAVCERDSGKLIVEFDYCYFDGLDAPKGEKQVPGGWEQMSQQERASWYGGGDGPDDHCSMDCDMGGRVSIPEDLREEGQRYVFESVSQRPNGSWIAKGRICYLDFKH